MEPWSPRGEFQGENGPQGAAFFRFFSLMTILADTVVMAAVGVINVATFAPLPKVVSARLGSEYHVASSVCLGETAAWIKSLKHDDLFTCVFESGESMATRFRR